MNLDASQGYLGTRRKWLVVAGLVIVVGLAIWAWFDIIRYQIVPKRFGVVEQGRIYRSGQISAPLIKKILTKYNIRVIIDLSSADPNDRDKQAEKQAAAELNIKVLRFSMSGNGTGDVNDYASAVAAIANAEKQNLPVLVHCAAGTQRTGGVIAMFRLLVQKKDPAFVISEMKHYGWNAKDNPDLLPYLDGNMALLAEMLKQAGVINEAPSPLPKLSHN